MRLLVLSLLLAAAPLQAEKKTVLLLIGEHEYGTPETLPAFAEDVLKPAGFTIEIVRAVSDDRGSVDCHRFPGLVEALGVPTFLS